LALKSARSGADDIEDTAEGGHAMTTALIIVAVWFLCLALFVVQMARRPKWEYPRPPAVSAEQVTETRKAA
jgi:hypothetical protein